MSDDKPLIVLILGGTTTVARPLVDYLIGGDEPRASFVRLADKFSVSPPSTYLDKTFVNHLNKSQTLLEYKQVNLSNKNNHKDVFSPPRSWNGVELNGGGEGFDVVFDLTGETSAEKPEIIQIQNTNTLALSLAQSSLELGDLKPLAWVRLTFPYYEMKSSSPQVEGTDLKPDGHRGRWWHETLRGIGALQKSNPGFKFGVIRCGAAHGPGVGDGEVVARLVVGHVYSHLKEEMKFLHNSDLRIHTTHTTDIAASLHLLARYLLSNPPSISESSTPLNFPFSQSTSLLGKRTSVSESWKTVRTVVPEREAVKVALFNVVDENDSTQEKLAKAVAEVWGIEWGFLNSTVASLVQQFAKTDFSEMVEDINEKHVEAWSAMLEASTPPILSSPITPFLDEHAFKKHAISLDGTRARKVLGFKPSKPKVEVEELKRIVKEFQDDGIWQVYTNVKIYNADR